MAVKVGEVMALRRAFDVAAPTAEERWDVDVPVVEAAPKPTLAERAAEKRAELTVAVVETTGLTKRQFVDALAAAGVSPEYAMSVRAEMYPDTAVDLSDAERRALLDSLTEGAEAMNATSEPLFTEWAPTETATTA
jgi:hypothetical protein